MCAYTYVCKQVSFFRQLTVKDYVKKQTNAAFIEHNLRQKDLLYQD